MRGRAGRAAGAAAALALAACATPGPPAGPAPERGALDETLTIFTAEDAIERDWQVFRVWRQAEFGLAPLGERVAIRARAEGASAGLGRWITFDAGDCPVVEWTWRVDRLPETASLSSREAEDVAASVLFVFGDPGSLTAPAPKPTLRYVWATETDAAETVVPSPYVPTMRSLVVRSGPARLGEVVAERRDLAADYARVFGGPPTEPVEVVAVFTDSDHGESPVEAFYLDAKALCSEAPDPDAIL